MRSIQRLLAYFAPQSYAQGKINDLLVELRGRGINFELREINDDSRHYFMARSIDYPRGSIITTGKTLDELEEMIKDAIFTAFEVPPRYCNPDIINVGDLKALMGKRVDGKRSKLLEANVYATA